MDILRMRARHAYSYCKNDIILYSFEDHWSDCKIYNYNCKMYKYNLQIVFVDRSIHNME